MAKRDGKPATICKSCAAEVARAHYAANRKKRRTQAKAWRDANLERARAVGRASRLRHLEARRKEKREYARSERGREVARAATKRWAQRNPAKRLAGSAARKAIASGIIARPDRCEVIRCREPATISHHNDYSPEMRLRVAHTCRPHHEHVHHVGPLKLRKGAAFQYAQAPQEMRT